MADARETIVFIPAWNEEQNLPDVLDELHAELPEAHVLVGADGSTAATAAVAARPGAEVLSFGVNRGLRAGIAAGYAHAAEQGYAYCGRIDADGQHPPAELRRLLELVRPGEGGVAVGAGGRVARRGGIAFGRGGGLRAVSVCTRGDPPPRHRPVATGDAARARPPGPGCDERPLRGICESTAGACPAVRERRARSRGHLPPRPKRLARARGPRRHARTGVGRVEAPREEGAAARDHRGRHAARGASPAPWPLTRPASSRSSATPGAATRRSTTSACSASGAPKTSRHRAPRSCCRGAVAPAAAARRR